MDQIFPGVPERLEGMLSFTGKQTGSKIYYWMQHSLRMADNLSLAVACSLSRALHKELVILYYCDTAYPFLSLRQADFIAGALFEIARKSAALRIPFRVVGGVFDSLISLLREDACCVVTDKSYLAYDRLRTDRLTQSCGAPVVIAEDNLIVPVGAASVKAEWAARTIRPRLWNKVAYFTREDDFRYDLTPALFRALTPDETAVNDGVIRAFVIDATRKDNLPAVMRTGGEDAARVVFEDFCKHKLPVYDVARNHPESQATSRLSDYLHYGMISPVLIFRALAANPVAAPFIEQLLVRRELAFNQVYYNPDYDRWQGLPAWSRNTLTLHASDPRPVVYDESRLLAADTQDACWNAAMRELVTTGYMENTMRMYWGKKVLEWSDSPAYAYALLLRLNNRYLLDGTDPNSYAGVGWCFGLHDRPWGERPVFGTVRYMNEAGLRRKYDMERYIGRFNNSSGSKKE